MAGAVAALAAGAAALALALASALLLVAYDPAGAAADAARTLAAYMRRDGFERLPASVAFREDLARRFASLAQVPYCGPMQQMEEWACEPCIESGTHIVPGTWRGAHSQQWGDRLHTFVSVARFADPEPLVDTCVIAFRGSERFSNVESDIDVHRVTLPEDWRCPGCIAMGGFFDAWSGVEDQVLLLLEDIGCGEGSGRGIVLTGHSMGGAAAVLGAYALRNKHGLDVRGVYTFEAPRVGNDVFVRSFVANFGDSVPHWRITHDRDPVVHLPLVAFGFEHLPNEVFYDSNGDYHICNGTEDAACSNQFHVPWMWRSADHCTTPLTPSGSMCRCEGWVPLAAEVPTPLEAAAAGSRVDRAVVF